MSENYAEVEVFGRTMYLLPDGRTFQSKEDLMAVLEAVAIDEELARFEAYLRNNVERLFVVKGKPAKPERAGKGKAVGRTLPASAEVPDRPMDGIALESAITRMVKAARLYKTFQVSQ